MITLWEVKEEEVIGFDRRKNLGLHHLAIKVGSLDKLEQVYRKVKELEGVKIEFGPRKLEGMGLTQMMCYEPSGIRIEFTHHSE